MTRGRLSGLLIVLAVPIALAAPFALKGQTMTISAEMAAPRVAEVYATTFGNLYAKSPLDGAMVAFPVLGPDDFRLVDETSDVWILVYEPLAGPAIRARVAKANGFVEFDQVILSVE